MRQLVPPGAPPQPTPPHPTLRTIPVNVSSQLTNKQMKPSKKKTHRNAITLFLAALILLLDNKTGPSPPHRTPHPPKDLQWPPPRLSICVEFTGEEMRRGSGGMQDGGQGTGSLHTGEEGRFFKETSSSICLSRLPSFSLSLPPPLSPGSYSPSPSTSPSLAG